MRSFIYAATRLHQLALAGDCLRCWPRQASLPYPVVIAAVRPAMDAGPVPNFLDARRRDRSEQIEPEDLRPEGHVWRPEPDSNRRVISQGDLQSPAFSHSAIWP